MKKVLLKGPLLTNSGYGVHSRQVFKALLERKDIDLYTQPTVWGNTSWILNVNFDNDLVKSILSCSKKLNSNINFDESYQVCLPNEWQNIANKNIGITAGFECDIVKESWIECCNNMDAIIVPSNFTKAAFLKTSDVCNKKLKTEINVINEWYYSSFDKFKNTVDDCFNLEYDKNILILGQISSKNHVSDRKNIIKTLKTAVEFVKNKEIGIVLKINPGKFSSTHKNIILSLIKENIVKDSLNKITLLFGRFSIKDLNSLYCNNKISCFLSGTRAEGWGLPFIEAAACGLPVIATDYSAYKEFLEEDFVKVKHSLVTFNFDKNFCDLDKSPVWAEFDKQDMLEMLSEFFKNEEEYRIIARNRQKIIKQKYNCNIIINNYKKFFESNF